jgi:hypothetical protein
VTNIEFYTAASDLHVFNDLSVRDSHERVGILSQFAIPVSGSLTCHRTDRESSGTDELSVGFGSCGPGYACCDNSRYWSVRSRYWWTARQLEEGWG